MHPCRAALFLALIPALALPGQAQNAADGVTLKTVKYAGLKEEVLRQRGKVVLVDIWGIG